MAASRSGTIRHHTQRPRFSPTMQAGVGQHLGVVADGRLRLAERLLQVARADLARRGDQAEQPQPHGIRQGGEHLGQVRGFGLGQRLGQHRGAAHVDRSVSDAARRGSTVVIVHSRKTLTSVDGSATIDPSTNVNLSRPEVAMSRVQLALNVSDLDEAIAFYSKLFATEPAKVRPGYANFAVAEPPLKLVLIEGHGEPGTLNHLGVEVESTDEVRRGAAPARGRRASPTATEDDGRRAATPCRTRSGSTLPTASRGRSTRCSPTPTPTRRDDAGRRSRAAATRPSRVPLLLTTCVDRDLARRGAAEVVGTALLVAVVVGSGIAAQRLVARRRRAAAARELRRPPAPGSSR